MIEWTVDCLAHVFCLMNHFESSVKAVRKASTHLTEEPKKYCCIFATPREDAMVYATSELKIRLGIEPSLILPRERLLRFAHQHSSCPQRNEANDTVRMTYPFSCS